VNTRDASDPVAQDLDRTVEIIEDAAAAIDEMLRYNRAMKSVAAQGVSHYRAEAEEARREADALAREIEHLQSEKQSVASNYEARIEALEQRLAQQERELESMRSLLWPGGRGAR
jgi:predicted ribosome quality control (RQC) complex YloA/Tae2 family protein